MVRFKASELPPITEEREKELRELAARPDSEIDFSDIPPLTPEWFKGAVIGRFYKPVKEPLSVKLDKDVIEWLKSAGPGYQTRMNEILRKAMLSQIK
jgi:Uncharacterized protein conserved in bacteria